MTLPSRSMQQLDPGAVVEMFVLDATAIGGTVQRFHPGTNGLGTSLVWQGETYQPFPVQAEGFTWTGKGSMPRPTLRVANLNGLVGALVRDLEDLVGAKIIRKRTVAKYLDAANFPGGVNPTADSSVCWPDEVYFIERKASETVEVIEFELASSLDCHGVMIPGRVIQASTCAWTRTDQCPFVATCAKTLEACRTNYPDQVVNSRNIPQKLPFGGFPGTRGIR